MPKQLSLRERALAEAATMPGPQSKLERLAASLPPDVRAELVEAVNDHTVPCRALTRLLQAEGYDIGASSIEHFRRQGKRLA